MQKISEKKRNVTIEFILILLYAALVFMFDADETGLRLVYVAYGLLCLYLLFVCRDFVVYKESKFFILYLLFGILGMLWAESLDDAITKVRTVFLLVFLLVILTTYIVGAGKPIYLIVSLAIGAVAISAYMIYVYGISGIIDAIVSGDERVGSSINNVNAIANTVVVGMIAIIGIIIFYKKWWLLLLLVPIGACFLAAGSRTATFSLLVGGGVLSFLKIKTENDSIKKLIRFIIIILVIIGLWIIVRNIAAIETLVLRIEKMFAVFNGDDPIVKEGSAQMRMDYIELGWEQFLKSPIWGNGIGCAGYAIQEKYGYVTYLHNNYIEILASGGIIGFILFYTPYVSLFISLGKRIFRHRDNSPVTIIAFALLIAKLIGHFGTVVYYSKVEYLFLALLISVVNMPINHGDKVVGNINGS